ncbi:MAG TPA: nuclear pore complex subunit [Flavobacteriales bacterium]|nr:nuclear pore complex subunit [Flavobacteriales bacterium]HRE74548.1 DUF1987 domain-containing protein [Flavobacteriales bacterium]HRJ37882.1 DUF1987 domain-containing protein [Flavobacteriales bacterium]
MDLIRIEATEASPFILLDPAGKVEVKGRSIPEDASAFFFPIHDWLEQYTKHPAAKTTFLFYLEYINSISQKMLIDIFLRAKELKDAGKDLEIFWYYDEEDEEMYEEGNIFRQKLGLPIQLLIKQ